jgi:hypothetical protein
MSCCKNRCCTAAKTNTAAAASSATYIPCKGIYCTCSVQQGKGRQIQQHQSNSNRPWCGVRAWVGLWQVAESFRKLERVSNGIATSSEFWSRPSSGHGPISRGKASPARRNTPAGHERQKRVARAQEGIQSARSNGMDFTEKRQRATCGLRDAISSKLRQLCPAVASNDYPL